MRHPMPIVTPRLILRPPTLHDLDSIQKAKEEAWPELQRWMTWAVAEQRSRQAMEESIRRGMEYQKQAGIQLAGFHRGNGDFVVRTALDPTDQPDVYETGYWVAPKYAGQGMATEAANAAIRYAFGHLGAKANYDWVLRRKRAKPAHRREIGIRESRRCSQRRNTLPGWRETRSS